ncbi:MAG: hypothetical protein KJO91_04710 [Gammaproteobacteria bacterium]|nr:hypothetical protein [Gammaproteobacteria bacterium]
MKILHYFILLAVFLTLPAIAAESYDDLNKQLLQLEKQLPRMLTEQTSLEQRQAYVEKILKIREKTFALSIKQKPTTQENVVSVEPICSTISSQKGWQKLSIPTEYSGVLIIEGGWNVHRSHPLAGPEGYKGALEERMHRQYSQHKYVKTLPFAALLIRQGASGSVKWIKEKHVAISRGGELQFRINDNEDALTDNKGSLTICFNDNTSKKNMSEVSFTGRWKTNWGIMTLNNNGSGNYTHDKGKITGSVNGRTLKGTWSEAPSYSPPNDAGDVEFTLSEDGDSFSGKWRYGAKGKFKSGWHGSRVK